MTFYIITIFIFMNIVGYKSVKEVFLKKDSSNINFEQSAQTFTIFWFCSEVTKVK